MAGDSPKKIAREIHFPAGDRRWVVIKTYSWSGVADEHTVIRAYFEHASFRDDDCAPGEESEGDPSTHGPYRRDALCPSLVEAVSGPEAVLRFSEWLWESSGEVAPRRLGRDEPPRSPHPGGQLPADARSELRRVPDLLRASAAHFLPDLTRDFEHEWGWVLCHFREWLQIDLAASTVRSITVGFD